VLAALPLPKKWIPKGQLKIDKAACATYCSAPGMTTQALRGTWVGTVLGMARLAVLAGALALAGCVTTENSLSANDIANMKLTGVTVSYAPDARVTWDDGIRAYAASKGIVDDMASATNTPEG